MKFRKLTRLRESSSPTVIQNAQHHDTSLGHRAIDGSPGTPELIIPDSTVLTAVEDYKVIRVTNTTGALAFLYIGTAADDPGALSITNAIALEPNKAEHFFLGKFEDDSESVHVKASAASVQIVVFE